MTDLTLNDVGVGGALCALGSVLCLVIAISFTVTSFRQWRSGPPLTGRDVVGTLGAYFFVGLFAWFAYSGVRGRHLLRVESRYTVATVTRVQRVKFKWESRFVYAVGGVRYTNYLGHGSGAALRVGSRWFVRFAAADPAVHEWRYEAVPAFLDTIPAAGWPRLPWEPPGTIPSPVDDPGAPRMASRLDEEEAGK